MKKAWVHLDESYDWCTLARPEHDLEKLFPDQYTLIPFSLWKRLRAVEDEQASISRLIDKYKETHL